MIKRYLLTAALVAGMACWGGQSMYAADKCRFETDIKNGLALTLTGAAPAESYNYGSAVILKLSPVYEGFKASEVRVRHGQGLRGPQYVDDKKMWDELVMDYSERITIPATAMDGDVLLMVDFRETDDSEWTLIWNDEFDADAMDESKWRVCTRYSSTWNKRIAQGDEIPFVNKFGDGHYDAHAIATPEQFAATETQPMITGAIESAGKFHLKGGRIEAKLRSRAHSGSFPAFWMMPADNSAGWPKGGEIDIWEQIDAGRTTYHTIHSAWTYRSFGSVSRPSPTSSGSTSMNQEQWHVYALEWDAAEQLRWYVDGKLVFTYSNQHFSEGSYTEAMTWPFDKAFYVIINQSVGDGSWAANCDTSYDYLTEFDYVRAYQRKDAISYYTLADGDVTTGIEDIPAEPGMTDEDAAPVYYNLQGIRVPADNLRPGIYIERRGGKCSKILVK